MSLCTGIGGLDIALDLAVGARTVVYVEREAFCAAALVAGMESKALGQAPIWDNLAAFDGRPWRGKVDIIAAGWPCQPFSVAGQRKGRSDERWIWPDIARILREVRPGLVFLENVPGLLASSGGFGQVLGDLAEAGFDAEWCVLGADDVGASHQRKRVFILAYRPEFMSWQSGTRDGRESIGRGSKELADSPRQRHDRSRDCREGGRR